MFKARWLQLTQQYLLCILAFVIPFPFILGAASVLVLVFIWLLQFHPRQVFINIRERKLLWPILIFYLLHAISFFYSTNKGQSLFDLQTKLSFVIFPLVVGAGTMTRELAERIFFAFVCGVSVIACFCMIKAGVVWAQTGSKTQFFYHALVTGLDENAVYEAWYSLLAIALCLFYKWTHIFQRRGGNLLRLIMLLVLVPFLILLSSKTLVLLLFIVITPVYIYRLPANRSGRIAKGAVLLVVTGLFAGLFFTNNPIKKRYAEVYKSNGNNIMPGRYKGKGEFTPLTFRVFIWQIGLENMKEHNLWWKGAGNGDVEIYQNQKYAYYGADVFNKSYKNDLRDLNLHNTYLEVLVMLGIPGLICLLFFVLPPLFISKKFPEGFVCFLFALFSCILMMQEAIFQTQAGIICYTFFITIFYSLYYSRHNVKQL